jgi:hypothetical protein
MASNLAKIDELAERIEALPVNDQTRLLEKVITPHMRLRLLVNQVRRQGKLTDGRKVDRTVHQAVKRVRRATGRR